VNKKPQGLYPPGKLPLTLLLINHPAFGTPPKKSGGEKRDCEKFLLLSITIGIKEEYREV